MPMMDYSFLFYDSMGYAFHVASQLSGDVTKFFENIEDVVAQADEVDEQYLQVRFDVFVCKVCLFISTVISWMCCAHKCNYKLGVSVSKSSALSIKFSESDV